MTLLGLIVGAMVGEYICQPEVLSATKKDAEIPSTRLQAVLVHHAIWLATVMLFGVDFFKSGAPILVPFIVLCVAHFLIEWFPVRDWICTYVGVSSIDSAVSDIVDAIEESAKNKRGEVDPGWIAASIGYGIASEKAVDATLHAIVILVTWNVFTWMSTT